METDQHERQGSGLAAAGSVHPPTRPTPIRGEGSAPGVRVLRLSVTDRCNLRCRYCLPADGASLAPPRDLPALEELGDTVAWLVDTLGIERVKLTGGEPLLRRGIVSLVRELAAIPGVGEVSMTTNGTRLAELAPRLHDAGLARVNVSLDTVDPERFRTLTRGGDVARVVAGIDAALAASLRPVKLNAVLRRSTWRADLPALLDFAAERGLELRFIELMRTGTEAPWASAELVPAAVVRDWLEHAGGGRPLPTPASSPARRRRLRWRGRDLAVGWITPVSHTFCHACDRLRLDARGRLLRCLMDPEPLPLLALLAASRPAAAAAVRSYLAAKRPPAAMSTASTMQAIGG